MPSFTMNSKSRIFISIVVTVSCIVSIAICARKTCSNTVVISGTVLGYDYNTNVVFFGPIIFQVMLQYFLWKVAFVFLELTSISVL
jgi:hypothetical protein